MKTPFRCSADRRSVVFPSPVAALVFLLAVLPLPAATTYTSTGSVIGAPVPGIWSTNATGQVIMRGNAHLVRVDSSDPRLTGRRLIFVDGAAQADGTALIWGTSYQEVGTFDATNAFTPTGGMWENSYRGTMGADNSLELHSIGSGWSGTIDGLRIDETMTRAPASGPIDPAIPYEYIGILQPPPLSTNLVLDNFEGAAVGWSYWGPQTRTFTRLNGQLVVSGHWPVITRSVMDSYTVGGPPTQWTVADGQTLEARVDLVSFSDSATWATVIVGDTGGFYGLCKGHDFMALRKWSVNQNDSARAVTLFTYETAQVPDTNVVLVLALTRAKGNVVVTGRVLDQADPDSVLYESSVVDTPNSDPSLTSAELLSLSGMNLVLSPDPREAPFTAGAAGVGIFQYNHDGQQLAAVATFDNLELRKCEIPTLGIARALTVTWPAPAGVNYSVEAAPTVLGPWGPVQALSLPGMQQVTIPAGQTAEFFRLRPAP